MLCWFADESGCCAGQGAADSADGGVEQGVSCEIPSGAALADAGAEAVDGAASGAEACVAEDLGAEGELWGDQTAAECAEGGTDANGPPVHWLFWAEQALREQTHARSGDGSACNRAEGGDCHTDDRDRSPGEGLPVEAAGVVFRCVLLEFLVGDGA